MEVKPSSRRPVVAELALRDLMHEGLITACLVLSVMAVLTPILLLTSVKVGFIDSLRQDFIEDPSFREIAPASADLRPQALFERISDWPEVAYAVPTVLMTPREIVWRARTSTSRHRGQARLIPSTEKDPVLRRLDGSSPANDNVAVTRSLAEEAGLSHGDTFELVVGRIENDRRMQERLEVTLVGMVPDETFPSPTILAAPLLDQQLEAFRSGVPVPERGWPGTMDEPASVYDAILVSSPEPLGETLKANLSIRVGAQSLEKATSETIANLIGIEGAGFGPEEALILLIPGASGYLARDVAEANEILANSPAVATGLARPRLATILGREVQLAAYPEGRSPDTLANLTGRGQGFLLNNLILLPEDLNEAMQQAGSKREVDVSVQFKSDSTTASMTFPLSVSGTSPRDSALVSADLLSTLKRGERISLDFDATAQRFFERSAGFRGFRIVATDIDAVPRLVERLEAEDVEVRAKSSQILRLQRLEQSLDLLIAVVASVALIGGVAILTSSFFANVQRKKVDYATLRLVGMPKRLIGSIPITQAVVVAILGFAASTAGYLAISLLLNGAVAAQLDFDGQLSTLHFSHFASAAAIVLVAATLSSLAAARSATRIDPAEALRGGA